MLRESLRPVDRPVPHQRVEVALTRKFATALRSGARFKKPPQLFCLAMILSLILS